jgi:hypothetical protein
MWLRNIRKKSHSEQGISLVEVLIVVVLLAAVIASVTAAILAAKSSSEKFGSSSATQDNLTNATAVISRELSVSPVITEGQDFSMSLTNSIGEKVRYLYYDPSDPAINLSGKFDNKNPETVPEVTEPSFIMLHTYEGETTYTITVLVSGVDMNQAKNGAMPLFTYYNADNQIMQTPIPDDSLSKIKRIGVRISAFSEGRSTPMEIVTSISPNSGAIAGTSNNPQVDAPLATVLRGTLPRPGQVSTLEWVNVAGATSYTLYRDGAAIATLSDDEELKYIDRNRPWGSTQVYSVIVSGPGGNSAESNKVSLTVVPQKPAFINIDSTATCSGNTVARDLTNCLAWTPRTGAVGYKLYNGSTLVYSGTNTSYAHTGQSYGNVENYTVIAYNTGQNGSGGDSITSDPVTLISPPVAPTLSGSHSDGTRNLSWSAPANAAAYQLNRTAPSAATWNTTARSQADASAIDAATFTYRVRASNDAGWGPYSNNVSLAPRPGTPTLNGQDYATHPSTRDGNNYLTWNDVPNAQDYDRSKNNGAASNTTGRTYADNSPGWASSNSYSVRACNITGCSPWASTTLRQAPSPFSFTNVVQNKRTGHSATVAGSQDDGPRQDQLIQFAWGNSAGASSYELYRSGSLVASTGANWANDGGISPGGRYNYAVQARAANGLVRTTNNYNLQVSPAAVRDAAVRIQSTDGYNTRNAFWGNALPSQGSASGAQERRTVVQGPANNSSIIWDLGWIGWGGQEVTGGEWNRNSSSPDNWLGGLQMQRTYVDVPAGYSTGNVVNQPIQDIKGSGQTGDSSGNVSWTTYVTFRGYGAGGPWQGITPNSWWQNVPYTPSNYPWAGGRDYEQVWSY